MPQNHCFQDRLQQLLHLSRHVVAQQAALGAHDGHDVLHTVQRQLALQDDLRQVASDDAPEALRLDVAQAVGGLLHHVVQFALERERCLGPLDDRLEVPEVRRLNRRRGFVGASAEPREVFGQRVHNLIPDLTADDGRQTWRVLLIGF